MVACMAWFAQRVLLAFVFEGGCIRWDGCDVMWDEGWVGGMEWNGVLGDGWMDE